MTALAPYQWLPHPYAYGAHSPERRQCSTLCWRGWCDPAYQAAEVAMMAGFATGQAAPPVSLPAKQCPTPDTCECECHDQPEPAP
jgi:hypothetical protein